MPSGGARQRIRSKYAEHALLSAIIHHYGGPSDVADKLNLAYRRGLFYGEMIINWRRKGYVPLIYCLRISKVWKVNPWLLNYNELQMFSGKMPPVWKSLIPTVTFLPEKVRDNIMRLPLRYG